MKARLRKLWAVAWKNKHGIATTILLAYTTLHKAGVL